MKKIRWSDFSLVSKIMIEVGVLAVLLFSINMLFYARINNSMQEMDDVYASNAQITELGQVFEDVLHIAGRQIIERAAVIHGFAVGLVIEL